MGIVEGGLPFCRLTNGSIVIVRTFKHTGEYKSKESTWAFYLNFLIPKCSC